MSKTATVTPTTKIATDHPLAIFMLDENGKASNWHGPGTPLSGGWYWKFENTIHGPYADFVEAAHSAEVELFG